MYSVNTNRVLQYINMYSVNTNRVLQYINMYSVNAKFALLTVNTRVIFICFFDRKYKCIVSCTLYVVTSLSFSAAEFFFGEGTC